MYLGRDAHRGTALAGRDREGLRTATGQYEQGRLAASEGKVLTEVLKSPWGITTLPDGRLLITEKEGTMRIATSAGKLSEPITGLPKVNSSGQGGLLGVRTDPDFATNRMVYWVFSEQLPEGNLTAVAKGKL